jgi:UDP-N-acetylglucosamine 4-epimerase
VNDSPAAAYERLRREVAARPRRWLVTGAAGFIGSHLVEALLRLPDQEVVGLDSFATGSAANLAAVRESVGEGWRRFRLLTGDVADAATCVEACRDVDVVLHQAALGSVPRSLEDPLATHAANLTGALHMMLAARQATVGRFVYASSSAVYGDQPDLPHREERVGRPLSPYAVTKLAGELYAGASARCYGLAAIGLRYFNVFGARQDPEGAYAAVIPRWVRALLRGESVAIHGDGGTSRDFCHVADVVQANLAAALTQDGEALDQVYNVGTGERTTLRELFAVLRAEVSRLRPDRPVAAPVHTDPRPGDVRHSLADIGKARRLLGYRPTLDLAAGLRECLPAYARRFADGAAPAATVPP